MISRTEKNADFSEISRNVVLAYLKWPTVTDVQVDSIVLPIIPTINLEGNKCSVIAVEVYVYTHDTPFRLKLELKVSI